ncbi:MAG: hypothetical protein MJ109_01855 [Kiritimatiellae bacterium]|nr:hypothetical protein [Kiritimatiellia bacterium]
MNVLAIVLAVLSIWDYPARQPRHEALRAQFIVALKEGDVETMTETCRKGVELLPDDPTWHYNLACSLAYAKEVAPALDELETAIDLGFRDSDAIADDNDLKRLKNVKRFKELVEYAKEMKSRPIMLGPNANVPANGIFGRTIALGEQNLLWDFDVGAFRASLELVRGASLGNTGDLYMNRDGMHSMLKVEDFPGLTRVTLDQEGRERRLDLDIPNMLFPYPLFGNASRAYLGNAYWRSLPRAMMTTEAGKLKVMRKAYLTNQFWVFPSHADTPPIGTLGDVFPAITPYCLITAGRSYSDQYYLRAALEVSRSLRSEVKSEIVKRGLLSPTIQTLIRKNLIGVENEEDYLSPKAHPTAFPANGLDIEALKRAASSLTIAEIPPLVALQVTAAPVIERSVWPELLFAEPFAYSFILRSSDEERVFDIKAYGADKYEFRQVHGDSGAVKIEKLMSNTARIRVKRSKLKVNERVDIAVFGKTKSSEYGAPSFVSFAVVDPTAEYSDPFLTPLAEPKSE